MSTTKKYPFSMSVLYQLIRILLSNCRNNLVKFAAFKSKYTAAYLDQLQLEADASEKLKGEQARSLEHESLRIEMLPLADKCLENWQFLKRYIAEAYGPDLEAANWNAAGWDDYDAASHQNWDKVRSLTGTAFTYIEEHEVKLTTDGFMPVDFKDNFEADSLAFNNKYDAFLLAEENAFQGTADKIAANNAIYMKLVSICLDGQVLYSKDEVRRELFSMEAVASLIKPTGTATVVVELTNSETNAAIPGFGLTNTSTERTVTANNEGRAEMGQQASGNNNYKIVADGFEEKTITVDVTAGTKTIQKISLTPIISEAAKAEIAASSTPAPAPSSTPVE